MLLMQMEIIVVEVDLEGAAGLHWSVHADIHGVSVRTLSLQDIVKC